MCSFRLVVSSSQRTGERRRINSNPPSACRGRCMSCACANSRLGTTSPISKWRRTASRPYLPGDRRSRCSRIAGADSANVPSAPRRNSRRRKPAAIPPWGETKQNHIKLTWVVAGKRRASKGARRVVPSSGLGVRYCSEALRFE